MGPSPVSMDNSRVLCLVTGQGDRRNAVPLRVPRLAASVRHYSDESSISFAPTSWTDGTPLSDSPGTDGGAIKAAGPAGRPR